MIGRFLSRIRRRETPFYDRLYRVGKAVRHANMPVIRPLHGFLRMERSLRHAAWGRLTGFLYYEPMFRTLCSECGSGLHLIGGMPQVLGDLELRIGNNVTMHGVSTFIGGKLRERPLLWVGDNTLLGYQMEIAVGTSVRIGRHVLIASRVSLMGYDFHPLNALDRVSNLPPDETGAGDIVIGDYAWLGSNCIVLKGVTIGEGAVVGTGSLVAKDIPPYTVAAGVPARVIKSIEGERPSP